MDAELLKKAVDLPWQIQVVLASGFCAYITAYRGIRQSHNGTDTVFLALAFGLIASVLLWLTEPLITPVQIALTLLGTVIAGMVWRKGVRPQLSVLLRRRGYSWSDDTKSAWERLLQEQYTPTQLTVELKDGRHLYCTDTSRFGKAPLGPYILGASGDVIMYVDKTEQTDGKEVDHVAIDDPDWGVLLTYIPKDEVKRIAIRNLPSR